MGKWIDYETDASTGKPYLWKCDECGEEVTTRWNFCPECGDPKTSKGKNINTLVKALEDEHRKLREMQSKVGTNLAEVSTDCISRQAAIEAVEESRRLNHHQDAKDACAHEYEHRHFLKILRDMPPAQPETATVTIGRTRGGITMWYKCDACDEPVDQNDNYCRNCGRRLKHE